MVLPWEELSLPAVRMPARYNSMFGCAVFLLRKHQGCQSGKHPFHAHDTNQLQSAHTVLQTRILYTTAADCHSPLTVRTQSQNSPYAKFAYHCCESHVISPFSCP